MRKPFWLFAAWMAMVSVREGMAQNPPAPPPAPPSRPSRPPPTTTSPQIDCTWLTVDSAAKTATFQLIAGLTGLNGALNFNGFRDGGLSFTVPLNWNVVIHFKNNDGDLPHSAEVIDTVKPLPAGPVDPAFPRAMTIRLTQGLSSDQEDDLKFVSNKTGSYMIWCAVPGHGLAGMWIRFKVSATDKRPTLTVTASGAAK